MRLLFVAPEICPPWTEGRKKLVCELAEALTGRVSLRLVTTGAQEAALSFPCPGYRYRISSSWNKLRRLHAGLAQHLENWRPHAVCHFPFGTFHGIRGLANRWSIGHVDRSCRGRGLRCLTVLYSMTSGSLSGLKRHASEIVQARGAAGSGLQMTMGVDTSKLAPLEPVGRRPPTILFMAGLQVATRRMLAHVIHERGLGDLIKAAPHFERHGVRVLVAVPLLRDARLSALLLEKFRRQAPSLEVVLRHEITVPDIFRETDLYLFPYQVELTQFIPTSILEAMAAGIPVVLTNLKMLAPLAKEGQTAYVYSKGNPQDLWKVVERALSDEAGRRSLSRRARSFVVSEWSIERSAGDLLRLLDAGQPADSGPDPVHTAL